MRGVLVEKPRKKVVLNIIKHREPPKEDWTVEQVVKHNTPLSWEAVFKNAVDELKDVSEILEADKLSNGPRFPRNKDLFRAFDVCPLDEVKVVIIGQDPYFNSFRDPFTGEVRPQAMGMSFSVPKGCPIPSSLKNIYREMSTDLGDFTPPNHGDLSYWASQGILLLNSCLTVRPSSAGCHKEIWLGFVKKVINAILDKNPHCIFVMWGRQAQKIKKMVGERATILESSHPSGLSCYRGFIGCKHFSKINELLEASDQKPIDWNLPLMKC